MSATSIQNEDHEGFMIRALSLARAAAAAGEVPVGAVLVGADGQILGEGRNRCIARGSPLAHAEIEALEQGFAQSGDGRLPGTRLYCTLEPCFMCAGAALHARVSEIIFATHDPKFGACGSLADLPADSRLNHRCPVHAGLCAEESAEMLRAFFRERRGKRR